MIQRRYVVELRVEGAAKRFLGVDSIGRRCWVVDLSRAVSRPLGDAQAVMEEIGRGRCRVRRASTARGE